MYACLNLNVTFIKIIFNIEMVITDRKEMERYQYTPILHLSVAADTSCGPSQLREYHGKPLV